MSAEDRTTLPISDWRSLPLSDWRSLAAHTADECRLEQCTYCGCCCHGKTLAKGCKVDRAPSGMNCPGDGCGCEGRS
jgi:hypothetical protein